MHIFFTVKNSLILLLMFYRLFVICEAKQKDKDGNKDYLDLDKKDAPAKPPKSESDSLVSPWNPCTHRL